MSNSKYFRENLVDGYEVNTQVSEYKYNKKSPFQEVEIIETVAFGTCLILDGKMQSSAIDEFIYHESLVHTAMLSHDKPARVFIGGGGEGATLREVLRHKAVQKCTMVDIDEAAVRVSQKWLESHHAGAFEDERTELVFDDAKAWLERSDELFDVMIMDLADPVDDGPCFLLYTVKFYEFCRSKLKPDGLLVTQSGPAGMLSADQVFTAIVNTLSKAFPHVKPAISHVPSFGDVYSYTLASANPLPDLADNLDQLIAERISKPETLRFFDAVTYTRMVSLPKYLRKAIKDEERTITEETPLFIM